LDDWYLGGDVDYGGKTSDRRIGGYTCTGEAIKQSLEEFYCEGGVWEKTEKEYIDPEYGIFGEPFGSDPEKAKIEKGSGDNRSFTKELEEMIYNVGLEYWYSDNFALRVGYIYDDEGKAKLSVYQYSKPTL
jgi:hypothetical protein